MAAGDLGAGWLVSAPAGPAAACLPHKHKLSGLWAHWMAACACQYSVAASYLSFSSGTPLPPSSRPRALRIIVMGCRASGGRGAQSSSAAATRQLVGREAQGSWHSI